MAEKNGRIKIICGHFGSGKTNVAVNLALKYKSAFPDSPVALADVDTVNPYYRAADDKALLEKAGIIAINPEFANTNVDIPSLPAELYSVLRPDSDTVAFVDVGGDDGAVALGMYRDEIIASGYEMLYVVSCYRPMTAEPAAAADLMSMIEQSSGLKCTAIVNNSSVGAETTKNDIVKSLPYARECARLCGLPLLFTSYYEQLIPNLEIAGETLFPMKNVTKQMF